MDYKVTLINPIDVEIGGNKKNILYCTFAPPTGKHVTYYSHLKSAYNKALLTQANNAKTDVPADSTDVKASELNDSDQLAMIEVILSANSANYENVHANFKKLMEIPGTVTFGDGHDIIEAVYDRLSMRDLERMLASYISFFLDT